MQLDPLHVSSNTSMKEELEWIISSAGRGKKVNSRHIPFTAVTGKLYSSFNYQSLFSVVLVPGFNFYRAGLKPACSQQFVKQK